jgi:hypothetical protein
LSPTFSSGAGFACTPFDSIRARSHAFVAEAHVLKNRAAQSDRTARDGCSAKLRSGQLECNLGASTTVTELTQREWFIKSAVPCPPTGGRPVKVRLAVLAL